MLQARWIGVAMLAALASWSCAGGTTMPTAPAPAPAPVAPPAPAGPPKPLEGLSIAVTANGLVIDPSTPFPISDLHVYQGARLTFTNTDVVPHDILSDPPHIHTDCPELNTAGYMVPGQTHITDPLNRLMTCGFHDHTHEGELAFAGKVTIEAR